jgi:hypothetical protein
MIPNVAEIHRGLGIENHKSETASGTILIGEMDFLRFFIIMTRLAGSVFGEYRELIPAMLMERFRERYPEWNMKSS